MPSNTNPTRKHDALLLFDVVDSNPNGDPDNAGKPRTDLDTGEGLVSDVSLKRKVRDAIIYQVTQGDLRPAIRFGIFIQRGISLNEQLEDRYINLGLEVGSKTGDNPPEHIQKAQDSMIERYFDVRMFGAVMSTGKASAGKTTGPVTIGIARSLDPVLPIDLSLTRTASTKEEARDNASQMGSKTVIPYGLYAARIHYHPTKDNQVTEQDLAVFWSTLVMMFEWTRSAARSDINVRYLGGFSHDNPLGNAPAHKLLGLVSARKREGVDIPRSFDDYLIAEPDPALIPSGVEYWCLT
jgi:CRISPR-associated protein Csd2